jgi:Tfp pilus assembly protein PilF
MSLLLEALKKAEKAKEEAQRRARDERPSGEPEELHSEGEAPIEIGDARAEAPASSAPLLTRNNLPEISPKLEILSDDLLDKPAAAPAPEPTREASTRMGGAAPPREEVRREAREAANRASARSVFEAKFREPNPRLPFYVVLGVLGAFGVSTFVYFWIQLRPPSPLVNANPQRQSEAPVAAVEARPAQSAEAPTNSGAIPGLPGATPASAPTPAPTPAPVAQQAPTAPRVAEAQPAAPVRKPAAIGQLAPRASAAQPTSTVEPTTTRAAPSVHPKVDSAYAAYLAGNLEAARGDYQQALNEDPGNRDALLGIAALDVRSGRYESAEAGYLRLLQADPRDSEAQAALMALRSGRVDPLAAESRLKSMLAVDPKAHALNFALGNQLAQQGRWAEAQAQYFKAFAAEPNNPDFAYNLAVSLDHLRQPKQALEYYKHAIALARVRGASFDVSGAEARVAQIAR